MSKTRILLVALDAAEPSLIRKWCAENRLSNLQRLLSEGKSTDLHSPAAEFPDEVWPSIYASNNSAELGKYYYIQPAQNSYDLELVDDAPKGKQFWLTLSEHARRCAIVDIPKIALGPDFNGVQIVNWGAHATRCDSASHPPELIQELVARHGEYPLHSCDNHGRSASEYHKLRNQLIEAVRKRGELFRDLLNRGEWDLFFCAFSESHCSGHQLWHLQDERFPGYDPVDKSGLRDSMLSVFQAIDEELGRLIELAGDEATVIVFPGHGMGAQFHGRDLIPALLELWGMNAEENIEPGSAPEKRIFVRRSLVQWIKTTIPIQLQYVVKRLLPKAIEDAIICRVMGTKKLDPSVRASYVPNNDLNPAFRVNLQGRDPSGRVASEDYEALCDFIVARLAELVNPATGKPAIKKVTRLRDHYAGRYLELLPDITAHWDAAAPIEEVHSPGYGTVIGGHNDLRTGGHASQGFLAVAGPNAPHIEWPDGEPDGKDLAPTILDLLDVSVPPEMEGQSLVAATLDARR